MTTHLVLPDMQVKPGVDTEYLTAIGNYIVAKQPDVVINIGDFADMPSLSSYDVGKKSFEGRRYRADIESVHEAMAKLLAPLHAYNEKARKNKEKQYHPKLILTLGNHENRINRVVESDPKLDGTISVEDLRYEAFGWDVYPFLEPVIIDGIAYCHYFTTGTMGRPCTTAAIQLNKKHMSCIAGHQQGLQIATAYRGDGKRLTSVIAGSCYTHEEEYLTTQGNRHWRGALMLHNITDGEFDLVPLPLKYLQQKYGS